MRAFRRRIPGLWTIASKLPTQVSGLRMWLDPTRGTVGTNPVTAWADQQGNVSTFANVGTDVKTGTGINGKATIDINTGAGATKLSGASALSAAFSASAWTFLAVFKYTGAAAENGTTYKNPLIFGSNGTYLQFTKSATAVDGVQYDGAYHNESLAAGAGAHIAIFRYDGTKVRCSLDGAAFDAGTAAGNITLISDTPLLIGNTGQTGAADFIGSLGDLAAWNVAVNDSDAAALYAGMKAKYGL